MKHKGSKKKTTKPEKEQLTKLVQLKFVSGMETGEIMKTLKGIRDRTCMAAVACLDLREEDFYQLVATESASTRAKLTAYRHTALEIRKNCA